MKNLFSLLVVFLFLFTACEEQMVVVPEPTPPDTSRKVLIEEFTGGACSACPQGASAIQDLVELYGKSIVAVAVHTTKVGPIGDPASGAKYNFQTDYGDQIAEYMETNGPIPAAAINRTLFPGNDLAVVPFIAWSDLVVQELEEEPEALMGLRATYDSETNTLVVDGSVTASQRMEGDIRVTAYITESHIIDAQLNGTNLELEYEHNHVLRTALAYTGQQTATVEGTSITTPIATGQIVTFEFAPFEMPKDAAGNLAWRPEHCYVVTFISRYDLATGSREVLQVEEVDLIQ
ncbi:MAG: hypothetical protein ACI8YQ_000521 [Polaribacter sp.]|jgi:hypothetical protein